MAFLSFTAARDSIDSSIVNVAWQYDGDVSEFLIAGYAYFSPTDRAGQIVVNPWLETTLIITALLVDQLSGEQSTVSLATTEVGFGAVPHLTAPQNVIARFRPDGLLTVSFDIPAYVADFPQNQDSVSS